jgi:hypothetical protein
MRINFFRERLLYRVGEYNASGPSLVAINPPNSPKTTNAAEPKTFTAADLVEKLGISKDQAQKLINGIDKDKTKESLATSRGQVTEEELFKEIKKGEVFDVGVRAGEEGDTFDNYNYNNKALLDRLDKLDGQENIKFSKENKDITWGAVGAQEETPPPPISPQPTEVNTKVNPEESQTRSLSLGGRTIKPEPANNTKIATEEETRSALEQKLKEKGVTVTNIQLEAKVENGNLSGDLYSYKHGGQTRYYIVDNKPVGAGPSFAGAGTLRGTTNYTGKEPDSDGNVIIKGTDGQDILINKDKYGLPNS